MYSIKDKAAIVGIGLTEFSRDSGKTRLRLACESILAAIQDAGLTVEDIDGIVKPINDPTDEHRVIRSLGIHYLTYQGECAWDTGASPAMITRAAMGVAGGAANYVVVFWTVNDCSKGSEALAHQIMPRLMSSEADKASLCGPFGLTSRAAQVGMIIRRHMHEFGVKPEQFGWVPVVCRENAARNPQAIYYQQPITIEDYRKSNLIADPVRDLDCHPEIDGAVAMVITTAEKAKNLRQQPVYITAGAQSAAPEGWLMTGYGRPEISDLAEMRNVSKRLFEAAGVTPADIDVAQLDDAYGPLVPLQLESLGFCNRGEGYAFCEGGDRIRVGGELPLNTSGGSLGEGYIYGMNHIVEAVHQLRGVSSNQVKDAELALVMGGAGGPASGLILKK